VRKAIVLYTAIIIRRTKEKFISVSLTECDLPSISIKLNAAKIRENTSRIHPIADTGIKNIPIRLNHGKFILFDFKLYKLLK
jgi:hypothetical protein